MPSTITKRRMSVLNAVKSLTCEYQGIPPTVREIAIEASMTRSSVYRHISALCDLGLLAVADGGRGIRVVCRKMTTASTDHQQASHRQS